MGKGRCRHELLFNEAGFTLVESVTAIVFVSIGLVALLAATTVGMNHVDWGRRSSTAVFLAEQRLEQIRAFAVSTAPGQGYTNLPAAAATIFSPETYNMIPAYPRYRRTTTITQDPGGTPDTTLVQVSVFYVPQTSSGLGAETSVTVSTMLARR